MIRCLPFLIVAGALAQPFRPEIPKTWDDEALRTMELPRATPGASPVHMSAERYYAIPVTTVFKTYSVTTPAASLLEREPEIVRFDAGTLRTKEDWIAAGKAVFEWPENGIPAGRDPLDTNRVVIRAKGKIEYGSGSGHRPVSSAS